MVSGVIPGEFYKTFKEDIITILYKLLQRKEKKGLFSNLFYVASITLEPKRKGNYKKENYSSISLMSMNIKILNKILTDWIQQCRKYWNQVGSIPSFHDITEKCINVTHYSNRLKEKYFVSKDV